MVCLILFSFDFILYHVYICLLGRFSCVQRFVTLCPPGSSVHGILKSRILEWVAMPSSRASSLPRDPTCISYISYIDGRILYPCGHLESLCLYIAIDIRSKYLKLNLNYFHLSELEPLIMWVEITYLKERWCSLNINVKECFISTVHRIKPNFYVCCERFVSSKIFFPIFFNFNSSLFCIWKFFLTGNSFVVITWVE